MCVCIEGFRRAPRDGTTPPTGVPFLPHLYLPIARYFLPTSLSPSLLPLSTPSPHLHSLSSWVDLLFFRSSAQSPVTTTTTCAPPVLPLGLPRSTSCATCRPGESGVEEQQERGGFQPSEERERRDGRGKEGPWLLRLSRWRPGWYCRPCVWLWPKWWVRSGGWDVLYCRRCEGTRGPRWGEGTGGLLQMFLGNVKYCGGLWLKYEGSSQPSCFRWAHPQRVKSFVCLFVCFFCCGDAIKSGQSGGF